MATYVVLINFTEKGIQNIKESTERSEAFDRTVRNAGGTVRDIFWTLGSYDGVVVLDMPDDESATALMISIGALGNVRSETLRAFDVEEFSEIVKKLPSIS